MTRKAAGGFSAGLWAALPIALGYFPIAFAFGVAARGIGLTGAEAFALSLMLFLVVYGRDRSAPVPDSEMMTINRVQSPFE